MKNLRTRKSVIKRYSHAAGAADGNRNVVINQFAAAAGENWRTTGKVCTVLLADGHLTRVGFWAMLRKIELLPLAAN